ncbi:MAG: cytochrome c3 family protein [Vitreoscilla sp.]|nr:cytochrome c3 family protein [Burkholderiales bacterium]MBP6338188.1 cytochrome c3 family protein [Vitreoscilla sp.]MBP6674360.1 cytochrome c3 family protein [Vitreoscilla sp.]
MSRVLRIWGAMVLAAAIMGAFSAQAAAPAQPSPASAACLACHDGAKPLKIAGADGKPRAMHAVKPAQVAAGVHSSLQCADCHKDVTDNEAQHKKTGAAKPDCLQCHQGLLDEAKKAGKATPGLELVLSQAEKYKLSIHSKPNADEPDHANAVCANCHDSHAFALPAKGSPELAAWRQGVPATCGACHEDQLEEYTDSIHGQTVLDKQDAKGAICSDCHNPHGVDKTNTDAAKLATTKACASCHEENAKSYADTYHGQIVALGYANTAKCYNCHGSHEIVKATDKKSKVHPDNRLKTCQKCHKDAGPGFASFQPHGNSHDFKRYPEIWLTTKFMVGLLAGTFAFFWIHLILWLYRESKDRAEGKTRPLVKVSELGIPAGKHVRRFGPWWRLGHLLFATSLMILTLTGMTLMYAGSSWAPVVMQLLGGPKVAGIIHRVNAVVFAGIFVIHLVYIVIFLAKNWKTFKIFGPDSLIPGLQDLKDVIAMFTWFLGKGPRPVFDRWTYWEKFDYWAPFWGVAIVGVSGFLMWFPSLISGFLPGWVFNVAAITHGEEAFLAAVFLFTVHFFNNHFRPDKFPFDDVMFTGSMSVEHFARDHAVQYKRLVDSGELQKYLVDAPSKPMHVGSRILGFVLISFGLLLLLLIVNGFFSGLLK